MAVSSLPAETPYVYIVERLFSSSLVVVVSTTMPKRMNIYHFKKGTEICNYSYPSNILAVKLNRQVKHLLTDNEEKITLCNSNIWPMGRILAYGYHVSLFPASTVCQAHAQDTY